MYRYIQNYIEISFLNNPFIYLNSHFFYFAQSYSLCLSTLSMIPAGTRRNNNVFTTSTGRRRRRVDVVKTLSLRHYCVMCPLGTRYDVLMTSTGCRSVFEPRKDTLFLARIRGDTNSDSVVKWDECWLNTGRASDP